MVNASDTRTESVVPRGPARAKSCDRSCKTIRCYLTTRNLPRSRSSAKQETFLLTRKGFQDLLARETNDIR